MFTQAIRCYLFYYILWTVIYAPSSIQIHYYDLIITTSSHKYILIFCLWHLVLIVHLSFSANSKQSHMFVTFVKYSFKFADNTWMLYLYSTNNIQCYGKHIMFYNTQTLWRIHSKLKYICMVEINEKRFLPTSLALDPSL